MDPREFILSKALGKNFSNRMDDTLAKCAEGDVAVTLRILLVIGILGFLGLETTLFAALLAAGFAIGVAWGGLLANFAAGVFLVFLRPFKVGDFVSAGGVVGTIVEIGLFAAAVDTPDNVRMYVGNNAIFSGNIQNYPMNEFRYWRVYFDTNKAIVEVGAEARYSVPEQRVAVRNLQ